MAAARPFWSSFFDALTLEGIFGDLRVPGMADRIFDDEETEPVIHRVDTYQETEHHTTVG